MRREEAAVEFDWERARALMRDFFATTRFDEYPEDFMALTREGSDDDDEGEGSPGEGDLSEEEAKALLEGAGHPFEGKYSPGQPRDSHGRWTSGGSPLGKIILGEEGTGAHAPTPEQADLVLSDYRSAAAQLASYGIPIGSELKDSASGEMFVFGSTLQLVDEPKGSAFADNYAINRGNQMVRVNASEHARDETNTLVKEQAVRYREGDFPVYAASSRSDLLVHELAHQLYGALPSADQKRWDKLFSQQANGLNVPSAYAMSNALEAWAEFGVVIVTGKPRPRKYQKDTLEDVASQMLAGLRRGDEAKRWVTRPPRQCQGACTEA